MGNVTIVVKLVGQHHNASPFDAEQMSAEFVRRLQAAGHNVMHAGVTVAGGEIDLRDPTQLPALKIPPEFELPKHRSPSVITHARRAFDAYNAAGANPGKTFDGRPVPTWEGLNDDVREKWCAAVENVFNQTLRFVPRVDGGDGT